jgi:hypothetical protein
MTDIATLRAEIKRVSCNRDQRTFERYICVADAFEHHRGDFLVL